MTGKKHSFLWLLLLALPFAGAWADVYDDTIGVFEGAGESASFFDNSYGYGCGSFETTLCHAESMG
jgi:hypothetical protein